MAFNCGLMVLSLKAAGTTIWQVDKEGLYSQMETSTKETGPWTRPMVSENTFMPMEQDTKATGVMTVSMVRVKNVGLIRACTGATTKMDLKMELDSLDGKMVLLTTAVGKIIKCTAKEFSNGRTAGSIKESITTI